MEPTPPTSGLTKESSRLTQTDSMPSTRCPSPVSRESPSPTPSAQLLGELRAQLIASLPPSQHSPLPIRSGCLNAPINLIPNQIIPPRLPSPDPERIPTRPHTPERMLSLIEKWTTPGASANDDEDPTLVKKEDDDNSSGLPKTPKNKYAVPIDRQVPLTRARARQMQLITPETRSIRRRRTLRPTLSRFLEDEQHTTHEGSLIRRFM